MSSSHSETYISEAELFEKHPYLRNFESLIGKLEDGDILGEASQGIVIRDDQIDTVFKIPLHKEWEMVLQKELQTHSDFYKFFLQHGNILWTWVNIPIPQSRVVNNGMVYAMQLIQGHCFKTLQLYSRFYTCIDDEDKKRFHFLTDHQFETLLEKKYGITSGEINTIIEDGVTIVGQFFPKKARNLQKALDFFGKNGFYHTDLHSGNIMMDRGWKLYIIDYWSAITPDQNKQ